MKRILTTLLISLLFFVGCASTSNRESQSQVESQVQGVLPSSQMTEIDRRFCEEVLFEKWALRDPAIKPEFDKVSTYDDFKKFWIKNICANDMDTHLRYSISFIDGTEHYFNGVSNEGENKNFRSKDKEGENKYIKTSNAEYVRIRSYDDAGEYKKTLAKVKLNKEFIIFDNRGGWGGEGNWLKYLNLEKLENVKVIVLQDRDTGSASEMGLALSIVNLHIKYTSIGHNTRGCVTTGFGIGSKCLYKGEYITMSIPNIKNEISEEYNFLGEGYGFPVDIYVENLSDFIPELQKLGVDTNGITIQ